MTEAMPSRVLKNLTRLAKAWGGGLLPVTLKELLVAGIGLHSAVTRK